MKPAPEVKNLLCLDCTLKALEKNSQETQKLIDDLVTKENMRKIAQNKTREEFFAYCDKLSYGKKMEMLCELESEANEAGIQLKERASVIEDERDD